MPRFATISSPANPLVKDVRRAIERGGLTREGWCIAETFHLLEEALRDAEVRQVLAVESARARVEGLLGRRTEVPVAILPDRLFQSVSATETSQGVVALVSLREWSLEDCVRPGVESQQALLVVLDGVQDPGNVGSIVRASEAFGASGALLLKGTASPYNAKTLRASAGSLFRVPFLHSAGAAETRSVLGQKGITLYAAVPGQTRRAADVDLAGKCALIIGSEAHGISRELRAAAIEIAIPTTGVESLNAAMAAGILLYEASRQRRGLG